MPEDSARPQPDSSPARQRDFQQRFDAVRGLRFSPELEQRYEAEIAVERTRMTVLRGTVGLGLFLSYLLVDWLLTPDVIGLAVLLRLGVVAPLALAMLTYIAVARPSQRLREGIPTLMCLVGALASVVVMLASASPLRDYHHFALVLIMIFMVVLMPIGFRLALAGTLALFAIEAASFLLQPTLEPAVMLVDLMVFAVAAVLALLASHAMERNFRMAYLVGAQQVERTAELEQVIRHDPLTGLANRRALDEARLRLAGAPAGSGLAVVVADIDHFKAYNDSLGHQAGDACLRRVAGLIAAEMRGADDLAIRFGGEEFLILLPGADLWTAIDIAERIRAGVEAAAIPHPGHALSSQVSLSLGVAAGPLGDTVGVDDLIAAADSALYAAKHAGRNQVWPRRRPGDVVKLARHSGAA